MSKIIRVPIEVELFDKVTGCRISEHEIWVNPDHVIEIAPHYRSDRDQRSFLLLSSGRTRTACLSCEDLAQLLFPYGHPSEKPRVRYATLKEAIK